MVPGGLNPGRERVLGAGRNAGSAWDPGLTCRASPYIPQP
jgi:hypothetical protein